MEYYTTIKAPQTRRDVKVKPISNYIFYMICKFIGDNDDNDSICKFLDETLLNLVINEEVIPELTKIDKFFIWLSLYEKYVDKSISLIGKDVNGNNQTIGVFLYTILNNCKQLPLDILNIIEYHDIKITLTAPVNMFHSTVADAYISMIYTIESDIGEVLYFANFTDEEKTKFLESLDFDLVDICNNIAVEDTNTLTLLPSAAEGSQVSYDKIESGIFDNNLFFLLKSLFSVDEDAFCENVYIFSKVIGGSYDQFCKITPREFNKIISIHKKFEETNKNGVDS